MGGNFLLIDADLLLYRAAYSAEVTAEFPMGTDSSGYPMGVSSRVCSLSGSSALLDDSVNELVKDLGAVGGYTLALTGPDNFRKTLLPTYKSNRKASTKPVGLSALRQYALDTHPCKVLPGLEADDVLGILATAPGIEEDRLRYVICSIDKDLLTVPGEHWNWDHPERGIIRVDEDEANRNWLLQCLTGDNTDGYKGLAGVGPVKASRILDKAEKAGATDWASAVLPAWLAAGRTEAEALTCARMARILTWADYDAETNQPRLFGEVSPDA